MCACLTVVSVTASRNKPANAGLLGMVELVRSEGVMLIQWKRLYGGLVLILAAMLVACGGGGGGSSSGGSSGGAGPNNDNNQNGSGTKQIKAKISERLYPYGEDWDQPVSTYPDYIRTTAYCDALATGEYLGVTLMGSKSFYPGHPDYHERIEPYGEVVGCPGATRLENPLTSVDEVCNVSGYEAVHGHAPEEYLLFSIGDGSSGTCVMHQYKYRSGIGLYAKDINFFFYDNDKEKYIVSNVGGSLTGSLSWSGQSCSSGGRDCNIEWGEMELEHSFFDETNRELIATAFNIDTLYIYRFNVDSALMTVTETPAPQARYDVIALVITPKFSPAQK